jgi:hypothetical protein
VAAGVLDQLRRAVEAHRLAVEAAQKGRRLEALEPGRHIHQQREAGRVGFRKAVAAETLDLAAQGFGKIPLVAAGQHAGHEFSW